MEEAREARSLLDGIKPPRIEDAGLEDCALPPESIREAFLKAASAVESLISVSDDEDESGPGDQRKDCSDIIVGIKEWVSVAAHYGDSAAEVERRSDALVGSGSAKEGGLKIGEISTGNFGNKVDTVQNESNSVS